MDNQNKTEASELPPIKTWQERCDWASKRTATVLMVQAMKEEIDDLRAALANYIKKG